MMMFRALKWISLAVGQNPAEKSCERDSWVQMRMKIDVIGVTADYFTTTFNFTSCTFIKSSLFGVPLNLITLFVGYGGLALSIEGPSKVDIQTEDMDDGTCGVSYCPTEPGTYVVSIRFAEEHVPGKNWTAFNIYNIL